MSTIVQVLKQEIVRLAKKETKVQVVPLKADVVKLKKSNAALRKVIKQLQRDNEFLMNAEKRRQLEAPVMAPEKAGKARITAKGVRALRKKLRLSQVEFAALVKMSPMSVVSWESKTGALKVREAARTAIMSLRGIGAREAKRRLELLPAKKVATKKVKKVVKRRKK